MLSEGALGAYFWGVYIWFVVGFFLIAIPAVIELFKIFSGPKNVVAEIAKTKEEAR
jgi:TRAP-type C4-dicarboxylate transport system permease small subunit